MPFLSLLVLMLLPLWAFLIHCLGNRLYFKGRFSPQFSAILSICLASIPVLSLTRNWFAFLAIPLLGHLYFQVFNLSETARRIRILVSVKLQREMQDKTPYASDSLIRVRIIRLLQLKQIKLEAGKLIALPKTLTFVAVFLKGYERVLFPERAEI